MADQYLGFYTPEVKKELEPIWRRGGARSDRMCLTLTHMHVCMRECAHQQLSPTQPTLFAGTPVLNARDRATADLSDTYESPAITDTSLRTAWKMSSQLSEHEAFDMQNKWPDSFM